MLVFFLRSSGWYGSGVQLVLDAGIVFFARRLGVVFSDLRSGEVSLREAASMCYEYLFLSVYGVVSFMFLVSSLTVW